MIPLTEEESKSYEEQDAYHTYRKKFNSVKKDKNDQKVKVHCHYTGKFRGNFPIHINFAVMILINLLCY